MTLAEITMENVPATLANVNDLLALIRALSQQITQLHQVCESQQNQIDIIVMELKKLKSEN